MQKIVKSHIFIGILSVAVGLLISFVLTPIYSSALEKKGEVVKVKKPIKAGALIKSEDIESVQIGIFNISNKIIRNKDLVIGKYARTSLYPEMYIIKELLSDTPVEQDLYLNDIPDNKYAISVTVQNYAAGLSSKLLRGDIVSVVVKRKDDDGIMMCEIPDSLMYMEVLSTTQESGLDKKSIKSETDNKNSNELEKLATVTLLANKMQVAELSSYEGEAVIHLALKSRNDDEIKKRLLMIQETYFEELEKEAASLVEENNDDEKTKVSVND